jgi:ER membrane protein complex subunit 3
MLIDPAIRDWVLIPLLLLVVVVHFLRINIFSFLSSTPNAPTKPAEIEEIQQKNLLSRAMKLRTFGHYITGPGFQMRKDYFVNQTNGVLTTNIPADKAANPFSAMDMMKQQLIGQVTQYGMFMWVQSFFAGFLLLKVPFSLTEKFKALTQQGVGVPNLDTSYVSSMSWYFIASFGLQKVLQLFQQNPMLKMTDMQLTSLSTSVGGLAQASAAIPNHLMAGMQQQPQPPWMPSQAYKNEAAMISMSTYKTESLDAEKILIAKGREVLRKKVA